MLRLIFWILLTANIILFASMQKFSDFSKSQIKQQPLEQINKDKVKLLSSTQINLQPSQSNEEIISNKITISCIEIGNFNEAQTVVFQQKLKTLPFINKIQAFVSETVSGFMVFIPPSKDKETAQKRIAELQSKRIKNYFLIQDDQKFRLAISLGIFKTEESAKKLISVLKNRGINDVEISTHSKLNKMTSYQLKNLDLEQIKQMDIVLSDFPQITKKECAINKSQSN